MDVSAFCMQLASRESNHIRGINECMSWTIFIIQSQCIAGPRLLLIRYFVREVTASRTAEDLEIGFETRLL